ncbi:hypothetical protein IQ247_22085 [Plectonema cf. radiosum LEGE 06105]|uniref:Uncharacterized protein n=1 Tax=Plectonema cf. radiosum LEGE 06105 TaxID=945769 RepID=A0A8J7FF32_9CYAN|nr:hypothetical protein [Plectonema radiosum]MBE9215318.1 hypothetical protein [Plectonema cf. radiosum LEGE 06105]
MLKHLLLSGWFRVQPFLKYVLVVILIAPLVGASGHSSSAKQSHLTKVVAENPELESSVLIEVPIASEYKLSQPQAVKTLTPEVDSETVRMAAVIQPKIIHPNTVELESLTIETLTGEEEAASSNSSSLKRDPFTEVELAPPGVSSPVVPEKLSRSEMKLVQRLKAVKTQSSENSSLKASKVIALRRNLIPQPTDAPVSEEPQESELSQEDPIGSPHPIPWKWITATQESVSTTTGSGVRYYRSIPVISPDGRYSIYSRVKLEVKPQMHESRVSSVLFVEDRRTNQLKVVSSTSALIDPLLEGKKMQSEGKGYLPGKIGVLVPVGWSENGERFLARKFEGLFNTAHATDEALIWNRQKNQANTVVPSQKNHQYDIAILLGWSKNTPDNVVFQAGEMGQETWPTITVANDGKTVSTQELDQPTNFGRKATDVWAGPQVAYQ